MSCSMKNKQKSNIAFYSSLRSKVPEYRIGGAETGSKRTVTILEKSGCQVFHIAKPTMADGGFEYIIASIKSIWLTKSILNHQLIDLFYMIGFYEKNVFLEWIILKIISRKKIPVVYEPKNGTLVEAYTNGSRLYRYFFKEVIRQSDIVFCQGTKYADFLEKQFQARCVYIPNYVMQKYLIEQQRFYCKEGMPTLIYFGRISSSKNIDLIMEIHHLLVNRGIQNKLILIGACDPQYRSFLEKRIDERGMDKTLICFYNAMQFDELKDYLINADFFVFPSAEKKEGHSNSLTEAMAFGTIPIASNAGFNREVIDDDRLIVSEYSAEAYADCIERIVRSGDIPSLRQKMMSRVRENYSEDLIAERMILAIESVLGTEK